MGKLKRRSFEDLVNENKLQLLSNQAEIEKIEKRIEKKHLSKKKNWQHFQNS